MIFKASPSRGRLLFIHLAAFTIRVQALFPARQSCGCGLRSFASSAPGSAKLLSL
jgi:hypothetical protein